MPVTVYFSSKLFEESNGPKTQKSILQDHVYLSSFTMWKVGYKKQTAVSLRRPLCIFCHEGWLYNGIAITFFIPTTASYAIFFFYCYLFWSLLIIRVITWSWHTFANQKFFYGYPCSIMTTAVLKVFQSYTHRAKCTKGSHYNSMQTRNSHKICMDLESFKNIEITK